MNRAAWPPATTNSVDCGLRLDMLLRSSPRRHTESSDRGRRGREATNNVRQFPHRRGASCPFEGLLSEATKHPGRGIQLEQDRRLQVLTAADNERLTRVGPASPMGRTMRRNWFQRIQNSMDAVHVSFTRRLIAPGAWRVCSWISSVRLRRRARCKWRRSPGGADRAAPGKIRLSRTYVRIGLRVQRYFGVNMDRGLRC